MFWVSEEALGAWRNEELSGKRGALATYSDVAIETLATLQKRSIGWICARPKG